MTLRLFFCTNFCSLVDRLTIVEQTSVHASRHVREQGPGKTQEVNLGSELEQVQGLGLVVQAEAEKETKVLTVVGTNGAMTQTNAAMQSPSKVFAEIDNLLFEKDFKSDIKDAFIDTLFEGLTLGETNKEIREMHTTEDGLEYGVDANEGVGKVVNDIDSKQVHILSKETANYNAINSSSSKSSSRSSSRNSIRAIAVPFSTHDDGNEDENENDLSGDYEEDYDDDCDSASLSRAVTSALHKNSSPAVSPSLPIAAARLLSPPDSPTRMSLNDDVVVSP